MEKFGCITLNAALLKSLDPIGTMLQTQWFCCCCHFYTDAQDVGFCVGHTPSEGEQMLYFTNIVVHNI